ncbi:MAG: hypothetical protein ACRBBO_02610 [Cognatishimia sp.]
MLAKALQTEIISENGIAPRTLDMAQEDDTQPTSKRSEPLAKEDELMLCQAKENLLQAQKALRLAQEAYDALASLRPQKIIASRRKQLQRRKRSADKDARAQRQENEHSAAKRCLRIQERARPPSFYKGFQPNIRIEQPVEELLALFEQVQSLDQFARELGITRRNAIHALKTAGLDVFEAISKDWDNSVSLRELSRKHGPMPQTISNWIKSTGREIKPRNSNEKYDRKQVDELFDSGWTTNKIAKTMELSWATVQKCKERWWHAKTLQT